MDLDFNLDTHSDQLSRDVAASIGAVVDKADGELEQAVVLQLFAGAALFGLSETLSIEATLVWLKNCETTLQSIAAQRRGELN